MKKLTISLLALIIGAQFSAAVEMIPVYIEMTGDPDGIENYESIDYITGKSERHYRQAWEMDFNEDWYVGQCRSALEQQASLLLANSVLNVTYKIEREKPEDWFTVVCQGLAAWNYE